MSSKTNRDLTETMGYQVPETARLCADGCGLFVNLATQNQAASNFSSGRYEISSTNPFPWVRSPVPNSNTMKKKSRISCQCCNKKVGLIGFQCPCGAIFCSTHRYPEEHSCVFDYKTAGRLALLKQNPVCNGDKLPERI